LEPERVCVILGAEDARAVALGSEPVRVGGELVVASRAAARLHRRALDAYAYLPASLAQPAVECEVEIFGEWIAGSVAEEPLFDRRGERIRG